MGFTTDALVIGLRALSFVAILQAAGTALFLVWLRDGASEATLERIRTLARIAAFAALCLAVLHYVLIPARMAGDLRRAFDPSLESLLLRSTDGIANIVRVVGLALLAVTLDRASRMNAIGSVIGAGLALLSFALTGHTAIHPARWALLPLLLVHLAIAAAWLGALWPLVYVAHAESAERTVAAVTRFAQLGLKLAPLVGVCGIALAVVLIRSVRELVTPYGAMVVAKTLVFAVLLTLATLNRARFAVWLGAGTARSVAQFARAVGLEWLLLAALAAGTGALTSLYAPEHLGSAFGGAGHEVEPEAGH